jgi:N-methylhydantoinase B
MLVLWRREEADSGGPGHHRGGVSASLAMTPYGTSLPMGLVLASAGKAVAQNNGLAGGYPGNTGREILARGTDVTALLAAGVMPADLAGLAGEHELGQNYSQTYLAPGDVLYMHWQGGGGYGDPLTREPGAVAADLRGGKITSTGATDTYGVVLDAAGLVDTDATTKARDRLRGARRARATLDSPIPGGLLNLSSGRRLDENLMLTTEAGHPIVGCAHCGQRLGDPRISETLSLARYDGPSTEAGPQVTSDPTAYVDDEVVFRQYCCPNCFGAIYSSVVPADHPDHVSALSRRSRGRDETAPGRHPRWRPGWPLCRPPVPARGSRLRGRCLRAGSTRHHLRFRCRTGGRHPTQPPCRRSGIPRRHRRS